MKMAKFRKKPIVIEAWKVSELVHQARETWGELPETIRALYETGGILFEPKSVSIETLEGRMRGEWGDWIIKGVKGEFYPCKDDIFAATYELVGE
jgi:hypothetical protein